MQRFFGISTDTSGNAIPSVTVTVNLASTGTAATLYSDNAYTPQANPLTSNTDGTYQFYAKNGRYDVVLTKTSFTFTASETTDVLLDDDFSVVSPAQIIADQNNYAPTNGTNVAVWRINSDAFRSITGITAPTADAGQRFLTLINTGAFNIGLTNASASSTLGNRFANANGQDYVLFPNATVALVYDTSSTAWRVGEYQGAKVLDRVTANTAISNSAAETTVYTVSVLGGTLGTNRVLRPNIVGKYTNSTGTGDKTAIFRVKYGATTVAATSAGTILNDGVTDGAVVLTGEVRGDGATNTQLGMIEGSAAFTTSITTNIRARGTAAEDSTLTKTLSVTTQLGAASNNLTFTVEQVVLEWLP